MDGEKGEFQPQQVLGGSLALDQKGEFQALRGTLSLDLSGCKPRQPPQPAPTASNGGEFFSRSLRCPSSRRRSSCSRVLRAADGDSRRRRSAAAGSRLAGRHRLCVAPHPLDLISALFRDATRPDARAEAVRPRIPRFVSLPAFS